MHFEDAIWCCLSAQRPPLTTCLHTGQTNAWTGASKSASVPLSGIGPATAMHHVWLVGGWAATEPLPSLGTILPSSVLVMVAASLTSGSCLPSAGSGTEGWDSGIRPFFGLHLVLPAETERGRGICCRVIFSNISLSQKTACCVPVYHWTTCIIPWLLRYKEFVDIYFCFFSRPYLLCCYANYLIGVCLDAFCLLDLHASCEKAI